MVMETNLMVDGDGVDDDGDEDGDEIPLSGVESRTNLTPKMKIVAVAALRILNESLLPGLMFFLVYKEARGALGPKGTRWRAPGGGRAT